ncbi:hypothetical protein B0A48_08592 [Cryoendolithus antarcticus]|uniref:Uncharacterized protein n=1 Tax=Cryoendolithus antarcticus TaxID=1507870 RepID=A0A1V8T684_9PEZI|nr:hypothetical protein B0A48_08592 [Cryoendolithus antarcticus]
MSTASNPNASQGDYKSENPGTVLSDSLAAESIESGGDFAADSDARGINPASAKGTTTNTTDTSGASELSSAPSRAQRDDGNESGGYNTRASSGNGLSSGSGLPSRSEQAGERSIGAGGGYATSYGDESSDRGPSSNDDTSSSTYGTGSGSGSAQRGSGSASDDFPSDAPNASFNNEIGTEHDPGREAVRKIQEDNVPSISSGQQGGKEGRVSGGSSEGGSGHASALGGDTEA